MYPLKIEIFKFDDSTKLAVGSIGKLSTSLHYMHSYTIKEI